MKQDKVKENTKITIIAFLKTKLDSKLTSLIK